MFVIPNTGTLTRFTLAVLATVALAGCSGLNGELDDSYRPIHHYQRYPIKVEKGVVRLTLPASSAHLSPQQEDAVVRFAQGARSANASRVYVRRPAGRASADAMAARITRILLRQGLSPQMIAHSTRRGIDAVVLSYGRYFASTRPCGNWPKDVSRTAKNRAYEDFGCATQHNLAAMVANPKDFETPRTMTAPDATRRAKVVTDYREPKDTATPVDENSKVKVSQVK